MLGIWIGIFLKDLDIPFHLSSVRASKADDPANIVSINERDVVEDRRLWRKGQDPSLSVVLPLIDPEEDCFPIQLFGKSQRYAVLLLVQAVFGGVELESHLVIVAT